VELVELPGADHFFHGFHHRIERLVADRCARMAAAGAAP
jgi:alpha/beta superfamily hydrolase